MKSKVEYMGPNYSVEDIANGDVIPVGGHILNDELYLMLVVDTDEFQDFFDKCTSAYEKLDRAGLSKWLTDLGIADKIETDTFATLYVFQTLLHKTYPEISSNRQARMSMYSQGDAHPKLSEVIQNNAAECTEISLLAHGFLNHIGIDNAYMSGAMLWKPEHEFSEQHSYIFMPTETGMMAFDPANPVDTNVGFLPSLYKTKGNDFSNWAKIANSQRNAFLILENLLSKVERGYGISSGANIVPERDFTNRKAPAKPPSRKAKASPASGQ